MEDRDFVRPSHGEFVVCFHRAWDQAVAAGSPEFGPESAIQGVVMDGVVVGPVYACGFCVAGVCYVVDVVLFSLSAIELIFSISRFQIPVHCTS